MTAALKHSSSDSSVVRNEEFDPCTADVGVDDGNIQLKLTGVNDGSTACTISQRIQDRLRKQHN